MGVRQPDRQDPDPYAYSDAHSYPDTNSHANCHSHPDFYAHPDSHGHSYPYAYTNPNFYAHARSITDRDADSHARAPPPNPRRSICAGGVGSSDSLTRRPGWKRSARSCCYTFPDAWAGRGAIRWRLRALSRADSPWKSDIQPVLLVGSIGRHRRIEMADAHTPLEA